MRSSASSSTMLLFENARMSRWNRFLRGSRWCQTSAAMFCE